MENITDTVNADSDVVNNNNDSSEDEANVYEISIQVLRTQTRNVVSTLLNPTKVIPTEKGLPRDWQGLAELIGITAERIPHLQSETDPTSKILKFWYENNHETATVQKLLSYLEELDRFDIVDDVKAMIDEDIEVFKLNNNRLVEPKNVNMDVDKYILTIDDVSRINQGLEPQNYDAFVLFSDEDIDFATELIETMEKQYNLKLCVKDRDLVGGAFEHEVIVKLISERCNRLIVIVSPAFLDSSANKFFVSFAQAIGIEQRQRKIVPCLYSSCKVPPELSCYFMLDYKRSGRLWNFWEKLRDSIQTPQSTPTLKASVYRSASQKTEYGLRPALHYDPYTLRPKKESVKFNSMVNLNSSMDNENIFVDPTINASTSSLTSVNIDGKKGKTKTGWLKKWLNHKSDKNTGDVIEKMNGKDKKRFWTRHNKRKVAVAN